MLEAGTIVYGIPIDCTDKGTDWVMFWVRAYKWRFMRGVWGGGGVGLGGGDVSRSGLVVRRWAGKQEGLDSIRFGSLVKKKKKKGGSWTRLVTLPSQSTKTSHTSARLNAELFWSRQCSE